MKYEITKAQFGAFLNNQNELNAILRAIDTGLLPYAGATQTPNIGVYDVGQVNTLKAFGDSITAGYGLSSPSTQNWAALISAYYGLTLNNTAVSGSRIHDANQIGLMIPEVVVPGANYALLTGTNDMRADNTTASLQQIYQDCLAEGLACLAIPDTEKLRTYANAAVAQTGTWTQGVVYGNLGLRSNTNGSTLTATVKGTTVYIGAVSQIAAPGTYTVSIDGTVVETVATNQPVPGTFLNGTLTYAGRLLRYSGLDDTYHTVVITVTSSTGGSNYVYIDWIAGNGFAISNIGPNVWVGNCGRFTAAEYVAAGGSDLAVQQFNTRIYNVCTQLAADGLNVALVNTCDTLNVSTDLQADGAHPTAAGQQKIANAFQIASSSLIKPCDRMMARTQLSSLQPTFDARTYYRVGQKAYGSDGNEYYCFANVIGTDPTLDDGTYWRLFRAINSVTLQCGTTGSGQRFTDAGSGIKKALTFLSMCMWNQNSAAVTIQTSTTMNVNEASQISVSNMAGSRITILGNTTTPANCVINFSGTNGITFNNNAQITLNGFTLNGTAGGSKIGVYSTSGAQVTFGSKMTISGFDLGVAVDNNSFMLATSAVISNAANSGAFCASGFLGVSSANISTCGKGINASVGAMVDARTATITSCTTGINAATGAKVESAGSSLSSNTANYNITENITSTDGSIIITSTAATDHTAMVFRTSGGWQAVAEAQLGTITPLIFNLSGAQTTGTNKLGFPIIVPFACSLVKWRMHAETAPTGASMILDVKYAASGVYSSGTTLWTTTANRPTLTATSTDSSGTAFNTTALAAGGLLWIDVAQVGSTVAGSNVVLELLVQTTGAY